MVTEVAVARPPLDLEPAAIERLVWMLADEERARAQRLRRPEDRIRSAAARLLARHVVAQRVGVAPAAVRLGRAPGGRPFIACPRGAGDLSLTHHGAWVGVALADEGRVGVDIACPDDMDADLAPAFCTPAERTLAGADRPDRAVLARLWAVKEAYVKLTGTGFRVDPRSIVVDADAWRQGVYRLDAPAAAARFGLWDLPDGAVLALAGEGDDAPMPAPFLWEWQLLAPGLPLPASQGD